MCEVEPNVPIFQVWVHAELDESGRVQFAAESESELTRGLAAVLVACLSGLTPSQVLEVGMVALSLPASLSKKSRQGVVSSSICTASMLIILQVKLLCRM
jgi:sulfur transfer protein SufE